jgi:hypothetical protein
MAFTNLLSKTPFHNVVTTKSVTPNPGGHSLKPLSGATTTSMQPVVPYFKPFRRPLDYHEYKKYLNLDAHVRVFKVTITTNDEMIDEEIVNLFNFTLKDNAFDSCNNYM